MFDRERYEIQDKSEIKIKLILLLWCKAKYPYSMRNLVCLKQSIFLISAYYAENQLTSHEIGI